MSTPDALQKARSQIMAGAMLVMGACVFGGLTAVVLMALGQRLGAGIVGAIAGIIVVAGLVIQAGGFRKLKAAAGGDQGGKP